MTVRVLLFIFAMSSSTAWALSLGDLKVQSYFSQPLRGEIEIPVFSEQELNTLQIQLAPREKFDDQGIEFVPVVSQIQFALRSRSNGAPYIAASTVAPVSELFFSIVVQVDWDGGSFVKSYDILLSPPTVSESETAGAIDATASLAPPPSAKIVPEAPVIDETVTAAAPPTETPPARVMQSKISRLENGDYMYGPVGRGDTLSSIAEKLSQITNLSFEKRKNILYKLNPQAFAGGKKHRLQAGFQLTFRESAVDSLDEPSPAMNDTRSAADVEKMRKEIDEKRELVKQFRQTNEELRAKLKKLEQDVAAKANELGLPAPDSP